MEFLIESIQLVLENGQIPGKAMESIETYVKLLLEYNQKVNLVSRKITPEGLGLLLNETLLLNEILFSNKHFLLRDIVDAGSGNGLLGIPIALVNENKKITLVETQKKKILFLQFVKKQMGLVNIEVKGASIEEYLRSAGKRKVTIISRGFPDIGVFCRYLMRTWIDEAVLITSENKIKKNEKDMESLSKKIYNVPLRSDLKILKIWRT
jgi:16S rRNA (guanine(527)-N(7))-methyltransferase RsmG